MAVADGLVRVGVQSAVEYPETSALIRKLMEKRKLPTAPKDHNILSVCVVLPLYMRSKPL